MYMCVRCRNPVFPVAKGYYRTLRRHLIFEEPYPCFVKDLVLGGLGGLQLRYEPGNERL